MKTKFILLLILVTCVLVTSNAMADDPWNFTNYCVFEDSETPVITVKFHSINMDDPLAPVEDGSIPGYGIISETNGNIGSFGVWGSADAVNKDESWYTAGVFGTNTNSNGFGVIGASSYSTGETCGVYGSVMSSDGYGVYSRGNAKVEGDLEVIGDLTVTGAIPEPENLALLATATGSSEHPDIGSFSYKAKNINDTIYGQWNEGEWASDGETGAIPPKKDENGNEIPGTAKDGPSITLYWVKADETENPQTFNLVRIWSRPNMYDQILDSYLIFVYLTGSGKPQLKKHLGMIPAGGLCKEVPLTGDEGKDVIALQVYITEVVPTTKNTGLAEIQCYNKQ